MKCCITSTVLIVICVTLVTGVMCMPFEDINVVNLTRTNRTSTKQSGTRRPSKTQKTKGYSTISPSDMISKLLVDYVRQEPPMMDNPTEVSIGIYVISFYAINEQTMDYSVSMYLRQAWHDPRLSFDKLRTRFTDVRLGDSSWNKIWIPDTFLRNEKAANFHGVTVENRLLKLNATGHLWYVTKISATLSCPMTLQTFPMDTQKCPMSFESFGYTTDTVYFKDLPNIIEISDNLEMPQFSLVDKQFIDCSKTYATGSYPCLEIQFLLQRDIGYFLIQVYVPSVLIVILSWVSFWINVDASPARVSIGLLTVLTTTTMSSGARSTLPRVSYIKAIDVWMIVCLVFVFASLIEYAVVNVMARKQEKPINNRKLGNNSRAAAMTGMATRGGGFRGVMGEPRGGTGTGVVVGRRREAGQPVEIVADRRPEVGNITHSTHLQNVATKPQRKSGCWRANISDSAIATTAVASPPTIAMNAALSSTSSSGEQPSSEFVEYGRQKARQVDKWSRKLFPSTFVLFNIVYWIIYTIEPFRSMFDTNTSLGAFK